MATDAIQVEGSTIIQLWNKLLEAYDDGGVDEEIMELMASLIGFSLRDDDGWVPINVLDDGTLHFGWLPN